MIVSSWSGFMKVATPSGLYEKTRIETLTFINLDPSNPKTRRVGHIYRSLCLAQKRWPLYTKATEVVVSSQDLQKVIFRLGGFHLLMSFLGGIGNID